jgi:hypothetical protein
MRVFELTPSKASANALLEVLPKDEKQELAWVTLGDSLCESESMADMMILGKLEDRSAREFSRAILLCPVRLSSYLTYVANASSNPHIDAAMQAQKVCQTDRARFEKAFDGLPADERRQFAKYVLRPDTCQALRFPED